MNQRIVGNDIKKKRCYLCGENEADSRDHIPPKNIFLPKLRGKGEDLITVPAHSKCNGAYSKDDEYFRFFLSIPGYWNDENARELWKTKIFQSLQKPKANRYKQYLLALIKPIQLFSPSGIYLGESAQIKIDSKRINRVVERIARGIFYKEKKSIMPLETVLEIVYLRPQAKNIRDKILHLANPKSFANGSFLYWWNYAQDSPTTCIFWFTFFNSIDFAVFSFDRMEWEKRNTNTTFNTTY
jgi:hypothetical protein